MKNYLFERGFFHFDERRKLHSIFITDRKCSTKDTLPPPMRVWKEFISVFTEEYGTESFFLNLFSERENWLLSSDRSTLVENIFGRVRSRRELAVQIDALVRNGLLPKTKAIQSEPPSLKTPPPSSNKRRSSRSSGDYELLCGLSEDTISPSI